MENDFNKYATRTVKTWLINTPNEYEFFMELAADARNQADNDDEAAEILAREICDCLKEAQPEGHNLYTDLTGGALECVDYNEVAAAFIEDL